MTARYKLLDGALCAVLMTGLGIFCSGIAAAAQPVPAPAPDPHYTQAGFFDLHVCTWPDRPLLFLMLFSTYEYDKVRSVEVFHPDGRLLAKIGTDKYRVVLKKDKPEKRVFMKIMDVPEGAADGWYSALVTMKDGTQYQAKDLVAIAPMEIPSGFSPPHQAENIKMPQALTWKPVPGAKAYQVYIKDIWNGEQDVMPSKIVTEARLELRAGILNAGGYYKWRVQARDVNENVLLGDFNHGSLSDWSEFSVEE